MKYPFFFFFGTVEVMVNKEYNKITIQTPENNIWFLLQGHVEEYLVALMAYFVVEVVFLLPRHRRCTGHLPLLTLVVRSILLAF